MRAYGAFSTPPVVKNLIIINVLMFAAQMVLPNGLGEQLTAKLALYFWESENFRLYQFVSYMFLHANLTHLFFNMFAFWMFGRQLEWDLGSKRFMEYYFVTGIGAALLQMGVTWFEISQAHHELVARGLSELQISGILERRLNVPTVGASGAVFGVLLAYGMLHPNTVLVLFPIPIPIKAKYFVILYGVLELFLGVYDSGSGVAHFAHVGGMLWGYLLLRWWKRRGKIYY